MENPIETELYRAAGAEAVWRCDTPVLRLTPNEIVNLATDAAVAFDRGRMATILRERILRTTVEGLPAELSMKVSELLYDLANQIEAGMIHH